MSEACVKLKKIKKDFANLINCAILIRNKIWTVLRHTIRSKDKFSKSSKAK